MEYKQPEIIREIRRRIDDGIYVDDLPDGKTLAAEFGVNVKTLDKALKKLVAMGVVSRRKRVGTRVVRAASSINTGTRLVEVIYEGFSAIFTHPFWGEIWDGMVTELARCGYRPVLNMLQSEPDTGLLKSDDVTLLPGVGKIILGVSEEWLFNRIKALGVPFVTACEPVNDPEVPQVVFDLEEAISEAVGHLVSRGCRRIAFVGQTASLVNPGQLQKYHAFIRALQKFTKIDPRLIGDTRPLDGSGGSAMQMILQRTECDAVFCAYDHQLPEIFRVLDEAGIDIPVVGCDGVQISGVNRRRGVITSPRRVCGRMLAEYIIGSELGLELPPKQQLKPVFTPQDMFVCK